MEQDKRQDSPDSVDLATAATKLGLTPETVRKRLQRGKLKGFKLADGTWRVVLDRQDRRQDSPGQAAGQEQDKAGQPPADALVEALRDEVRFLRSQLQARDDEIRRVHVLLQQEQHAVKSLADQRAASQGQAEALERDLADARRPWWRRWWR